LSCVRCDLLYSLHSSRFFRSILQTNIIQTSKWIFHRPRYLKPELEPERDNVKCYCIYWYSEVILNNLSYIQMKDNLKFEVVWIPRFFKHFSARIFHVLDCSRCYNFGTLLIQCVKWVSVPANMRVVFPFAKAERFYGFRSPET